MFDFGVLTWALVRALARAERVRGEWVRVPFATGDGSDGRWRRAFGATAGNAFANAVVVDVDDGRTALLHALDAERYTAKTVI